MLTPALIRGARAILQMSQAELAEKAGISKTGLANLETGKADSRGSTLDSIQKVLESAGAEFVAAGGGGLAVRPSQTFSQRRLESGGANGYRYKGGVEFGMIDAGRIVVCRVSEEALQQDDEHAARDYVAAFQRRRAKIEQIAAAKYGAEQLDDGFVVVKSVDVQAFRGLRES
jgi:transcriptional regulator with XRE-family HTH domain